MASSDPSTGASEKGGTWVQLEQQSMAPPPRFGASLTACGDEVLLFGGCQEDASGGMHFYNDLYRLALRLTIESELDYIWEMVPSTGQIPAPRESHCACAVKGELYVFGGIGTTDGNVSGKHIYSFSPVTKKWSVKESQGVAPEFQNMSCVTVEGQIFTFGGVHEGVTQCKLFILDLNTMTWSSPTCTGFLPTSRCDHSAAMIGQKMYVFGGSASSSLLLNDLCVLDTETLEWNPVPVSSSTPDPREYCSLTAMGDRHLLLFGGYSSSNRGSQEQTSSNDLYLMDLSDPSPHWHPFPSTPGAESMPAPRYSHSAIAVLNFLLVFGGMGHTSDLNDLWAFRVNTPPEQLIGFYPTLPPPVHYPRIPALLPGASQHPPAIRVEKVTLPREVEELQTAILQRVNELFDGLKQQVGWIEEERSRIRGERELVQGDRRQLLSEVAEKTSEIDNMIQSHQKSNEEWIRKRCHENDSTRKELNRQRRALQLEREELEKREKECLEKDRKLSGLMEQFEKMKS